MLFLQTVDAQCIGMLCRTVSKLSSRGSMSWSSMLMQTLFLQLLETNVTWKICGKFSTKVIRVSLLHH